jgi:hypothetical protein
MRTIPLSRACLVTVWALLCACGGCISRDSDGQSRSAVQYIETRNENGDQISFEGYFRNGRAVEHGKCRIQFTEGMRCEMLYRDGVADGLCIWYYADGTMAMEGTYVDDRPWDGVLMTIGITVGEPHQYKAGSDLGIWQDPRGIFVDE